MEKKVACKDRPAEKKSVEIYEKSSDLYDAVNSRADKKLVENYRKFYKF
jgi:hypothetical protein